MFYCVWGKAILITFFPATKVRFFHCSSAYSIIEIPPPSPSAYCLAGESDTETEIKIKKDLVEVPPGIITKKTFTSLSFSTLAFCA